MDQRLHSKILFLVFFVLSGNLLWGQATLPVTRTVWNAGAPTGWTDNGTGSYTSSFACGDSNMGKLDTTGDYYQVWFDVAPADLTFVLKGASASGGSTVKVQESVDGVSWSDIGTYTDYSGGCASPITLGLTSTSRYVKILYDVKVGGNYGVDDLSITALAATKATLPINRTVWGINETGWMNDTDAYTVGGSALRLDASGDFVSVCFLGTACELNVRLSASGSGWAGVAKIQSSSDGTTWTDLETITAIGSSNLDGIVVGPLAIPATATSVRVLYDTKTSGNLRVDDFELLECPASPTACYTDNGNMSIQPVTLNSDNDNWEVITNSPNATTYNGYGYCNCASPSELWLVSPSFDLGAVTTRTLKFFVGEDYTGASMEVLWSTTGDVNTPGDWTSIASITSGATGTQSIDISALSGNPVFFGVKYTSTGQNGSSSSWFLHNFRIEATPDCTTTVLASCVISDITLSNINTTCNQNGTATDGSDDYFTADVTLTFANPPATGTLDLTGDVVGTYSIAVGSLGATSYTFTGVQLTADGTGIDLTATFSGDLLCTLSKIDITTGVSPCVDPSQWIFAPSTPAEVLVGQTTTITVCNADDNGDLVTQGFIPPDPSFFAFSLPGTTVVSGPTGTGPCYDFEVTFDQAGVFTMYAADAGSVLAFDQQNIGVVFPSCAVISEVSGATTQAERYVEIFNPTCADMDISGFKLEQWSQNGNLVYTLTVPASTILGAFETFVFANTPASIGGCGEDTALNGNGDDTYILKDASNRTLDQFGELGVDGDSQPWGYSGMVAIRDYDVCCGNLGAFDNAATGWTFATTTSATPCEHVTIAPYGAGTFTADKECTDIAGWTHYYDTANRYLLFSVKKNGQDIGAIGDAGFAVNLYANSTSSLLSTGTGNYVTNPDGWEIMNRYWKLDVATGKEPSAAVNVKFYYTTDDYNYIAGDNGEAITAAAHSELYAWKINDYTTWNMDPTSLHPTVPFAGAYDQDGFWQYTNAGAASSLDWYYNTILTDFHYAEYQVGHFGAGGLGVGGATGDGAFPVELLSFEAIATPRNQVALSWKTASEVDNDYFVVEHSLDGNRFAQLGKVDGNGTTSEMSSYEFLHQKPILGVNYYRLKQIDIDGSYTYSPIKSVLVDKTTKIFTVRPTLVQEQVYLTLMSENRSDVQIDIISIVGKIITTQSTQVNGFTTYDLNLSDLKSGTYFIKVSSNGISQTEKIVKY